MTLHEFNLTLEGREKKLERQMEMLAWHAANIINHRTPAMGEKRRKTITPAQLLGRESEQSLEANAAKWKAFVRSFQRSEARGA